MFAGHLSTSRYLFPNYLSPNYSWITDISLYISSKQFKHIYIYIFTIKNHCPEKVCVISGRVLPLVTICVFLLLVWWNLYQRLACFSRCKHQKGLQNIWTCATFGHHICFSLLVWWHQYQRLPRSSRCKQ